MRTCLDRELRVGQRRAGLDFLSSGAKCSRGVWRLKVNCDKELLQGRIMPLTTITIIFVGSYHRALYRISEAYKI